MPDQIIGEVIIDGVARMLRAATSYYSMAGPSARRTVEARSGLAAGAGLRQIGAREL
jgi:hypothetical protein